VSGRVAVRVPASTSNLGAGFDCVGMAVGRWLTVDARLERGGAPGVRLERHGTLEALALPPARDLVWRGFAAACRAAGRRVPAGVVLRATSDIPLGRGLGSSAAALVAGAAAANALLGLGLSGDALFRLVAGIEGHPDNAAPAVYGGARLVVGSGNGGSVVVPVEVHRSLAFVFVVPDFAVATAKARAVLPRGVSFGTAVKAASRAAALVAGLARADAPLLAAALDDVLHVPHRRRLVRGYVAVVRAARAAGAFGATLSGSGSAIVAVASRARAAAVARAMTRAWRAAGVEAETFEIRRPAAGYHVTRASSRKRSVNV
jgi:homoserine kinase